MIKTENLSKIFRTEEVETVALNGVSINVEDGEFVAIMGPSAASRRSSTSSDSSTIPTAASIGSTANPLAS